MAGQACRRGEARRGEAGDGSKGHMMSDGTFFFDTLCPSIPDFSTEGCYIDSDGLQWPIRATGPPTHTDSDDPTIEVTIPMEALAANRWPRMEIIHAKSS